MKRVLILLAVATITAESVGCCCCPGLGSCCPCRRLFSQGAYCGSPCCPAPVVAGPAPCYPAPVMAAAPAPCCPTPVAATAPAPQYQYAVQQPAPMLGCPTCTTCSTCQPPCQTCQPPCPTCPTCAPAPTPVTYAMEPCCAYPKLVYDSGWIPEADCSCSGDGGIILQSPDDAVYPSPAE